MALFSMLPRQDRDTTSVYSIQSSPLLRRGEQELPFVGKVGMEDLAVIRAGSPRLLAEIDYVVVDEVQPFVEGTVLVTVEDLYKILRSKVGASGYHCHLCERPGPGIWIVARQ